MNNCVMLRYGEIGLKSNRTRPFFEKLYVRSIKEALERHSIKNYTITNLGGRFIIEHKKPENIIDLLTKVPGIQSLSPAKKFSFSTKKELIKKIKKDAENIIKDKIFAVKAKRVGKHSFTSVELAKEIAEAIHKEGKGIHLKSPEVFVNVEVRDNDCYLYSETFKGVGGLPAGSSGKVLCLFSGGIDSPVAAFEMLKRGCKVDFLFVNIVGEKLLSDVGKVYNYLADNYCYSYKPKIFIVNGKEIIKKLKEKVPDSLRQIAYKVMLYKIGSLIAEKNAYLSLVSGESIAQKSSQTLQSLICIEKKAATTMLRPLLTFDKVELLKIAKELGTLSISEKIKEYCNLSEGKVTTSPREQDMKKIPLFEKEILEAVEKVLVVKGLIKIGESEDMIPFEYENLITVDIRTSSSQKKHPLKTDMKAAYPDIFRQFNKLDRNKFYLFICDFGVKSEDVAFELRKKGFKAVGISTHGFLNYFSKKKCCSL